MKSLKEKQFLVNMAKALGQTPDPALVKEIDDHNKIMESITPMGDEFSSLISQLQQLKDEVETIKTTVEVKQQYFPKPPSLDDLFASMAGEEVAETIEVPIVDEQIEQGEQSVEPIEPVNPLIDAVSKHITNDVKNEAQSFQQPVIDPVVKSLDDIRKKISYLESWMAKISAAGPGSGEVNLKNLDDFNKNGIDFRDPASSTAVDGMAVVYNAANAKFELQAVSGGNGGGAVNSVNGKTGTVVLTTANVSENANLYFTNARSIASLTAGTNITIAANGRISSSGGGGGSVDLTSVSSNVIPDTDSFYDLGSLNKRWKTLYLANNTIDLGGALISSDGTGIITISSSGAVLPVNSKVTVDGNEKQIALVGNTGAIASVVPFYTQNLGLNTTATNFTFGANPDSYVFTNFYTSTGATLTQSTIAQFYF